MTTVYGSWTPNSSQNNRIRLYVVYSVPSVSAGQTSVSVSWDIRLETYYRVSDSNNTFAWGGSLIPDGSSPKDIDLSTGSTMSLRSGSTSVSLTDSTQSKSITGSLTGIDYIGSSNTATVSATVTIPAKVYDPPAAATSLTITRQADNRHVLNWGASPSGAPPITHFQIARQPLSTGKWVYPALPSGTARSWTDTTDLSDDKIRWGIRAYNSAGGSDWLYSSYVWTTPAAASGVSASRVGSDAVVSWAINALDAEAQKVQVSSSADSGATWSAWADIAGHTGLAPTVTSRTVSGLSGVQWHRFRVVTSVSTPVTLVSESAASAALVLLTTPLAPTPLAPLGTVSTTDDAVFIWDHRPVDTTAQTSAEVRWSVNDWATSTTATATTAETLTIAAGTWSPGPVKWQIRTKGQHADWSPWSSVVSFEVAAPPAVTIDIPTDLSTWTSNRMTATITFTDPQGASMTGWSATLATGGQVIESVTGTGTTVAFASLLTDGEDYTASVVATSGTGLVSSAATATVMVDFLDPLPPTIEATWDEPNGTVSLVVGFTAPVSGEAVTDHVRVERLEGPEWTIVADGLPDLAGIGDDRVALNLDAQYRAVAVSALGVEASATTTVTTSSSRVWLASEDGRIQILHNLSITPTFGHERVTETYLGDIYPTAHYGIARPVQIAVSGLWLGDEMAQDVNVALGRDVWYRDRAGRAFLASVDAVPAPEPNAFRRVISLRVERVNG